MFSFWLLPRRSHHHHPVVITDTDFADDTSTTEEIHQAQGMLASVKLEAVQIGLHLNSKKTEVKHFNQGGVTTIKAKNGGEIKSMNHFKYLGGWLEALQKILSTKGSSSLIWFPYSPQPVTNRPWSCCREPVARKLIVQNRVVQPDAVVLTKNSVQSSFSSFSLSPRVRTNFTKFFGLNTFQQNVVIAQVVWKEKILETFVNVVASVSCRVVPTYFTENLSTNTL